MLVLGDAGMRCEELARVERRDFKAARAGAKLRTKSLTEVGQLAAAVSMTLKRSNALLSGSSKSKRSRGTS